MVLSIQVSLYNAEIIPNIMPKIIAMTIAETAKTKVLGMVSPMTSVTFFHCLVKDSLKYGVFITVVVFPMVKSSEALYLFGLRKV